MIKLTQILENIIDINKQLKKIMSKFNEAKNIFLKNCDMHKKIYLLNNAFRDLKIKFVCFEHNDNEKPLGRTGIIYSSLTPINSSDSIVLEFDTIIQDSKFMQKNYDEFLKEIEHLISHELVHVEQLKRDERDKTNIHGTSKIEPEKYTKDKREIMAFANEFINELKKKKYSRKQMLNIIQHPHQFQETIFKTSAINYLNKFEKLDDKTLKLFLKYSYLYAIS